MQHSSVYSQNISILKLAANFHVQCTLSASSIFQLSFYSCTLIGYYSNPGISVLFTNNPPVVLSSNLLLESRSAIISSSSNIQSSPFHSEVLAVAFLFSAREHSTSHILKLFHSIRHTICRFCIVRHLISIKKIPFDFALRTKFPTRHLSHIFTLLKPRLSTQFCP